MNTKLFEHQKMGVKKLSKRKCYALFMEQGTGKTLTMITHMNKLVKKGRGSRFLIFAPTSVLDNWEIELNKFAPDKYDILNFQGKKDKRADAFKEFNKPGTKPKVLIVNYEKSDKEIKALTKFKADVLICDESQKIKNQNSKTNRRIFSLAKKIPRRYLMTGTPISKGYEDIFGQFKVMKPELLGTAWKQFEELYVIKGGYMGKEIKGYQNTKKLKKLISKNSFRVKKSECLNLPPVTEQDVKCELSAKARKIYNQLNKEMYVEIAAAGVDIKAAKKLLKDNGITVGRSDSPIRILHQASKYSPTYEVYLELALNKNIKLQQICGGFIKNEEDTLFLDSSKITQLEELVEGSSKPIVVFCNFRAELSLIKSTFKKKGLKVAEISGQTKNRGKIIQNFQSGKYDMIVVQIASGSAGITLTRSSTMVFYSWNYRYIDYSQAKARIDRIGQENPVNIYYLVSRGTIDEDILEVLREREKISEEIMK